MRAIASVAIAGMLAATSLATTTVSADAGGKYWKHRGHHYHHRHHSRGWNPGAALATGAILGLSVGALAAPRYYEPPPPRVYYYPPPAPPPAYPAYYAGSGNAQHVSWCYSRYRSYDARDNTWVDFHGRVRECRSPYAY